MKRVVRIIVRAAAIVGLMGLTMGATGNPDPGRTGAANDGGTSGPHDSGSSSGSGCSR